MPDNFPPLLAESEVPLLHDGPWLGGVLKTEPEDFVVEEIPAYAPSGEGEHLFLKIRKRDCSAEFLERVLARQLDISRRDIGTAGMKDRRAVTTQWVSVPGTAADRVEGFSHELVTIEQAIPHVNKLRTGHLQGNRFRIRVRGCDPDGLAALPDRIADIRRLGVPNAYGSQRFGHDLQTLRDGWQTLAAFTRRRGGRRGEFQTRLELSAVQSALFNLLLTRRMNSGDLHRIQTGDVMRLLPAGAMFVVEDPVTEQARFDARETVVTGPMYGPKMRQPTGRPGEEEAGVLSDLALTAELFEHRKKLMQGTRRPLLVYPDDLAISEQTAADCLLTMTLPPGSYATVVMREIMGPTADVPPAEPSLE